MVVGNFAVIDFMPPCTPVEDTDIMDTRDLATYKRTLQHIKKRKKESYNRIKTKIKELRPGYTLSVDKGSRSGLGKLVCDYFKKLQQI